METFKQNSLKSVGQLIFPVCPPIPLIISPC